MDFRGVEICCPACKGDLTFESTRAQSLLCDNCGRQFPILMGIPDLRVCSDPYLSNDDDWKKASELAAEFGHRDFAGLVSLYYQGKKDVPTNLVRQYISGMMAGEARADGVLQSWESIADRNFLDGSPILEIGCGTGPLLQAAGMKRGKLVGVDIGLRWLVLCKRRLADAHLEIPLFCACAEALPFPDRAFHAVMSESTLENVQNQGQALDEMNRVMTSGGYLCLSTPNKYSLGPDPHTGILAGGYLPDKWTAGIMRRRGAIPPIRRLISARELNRMIPKAGFAVPRVFPPDIPDRQSAHFGQGLKIAAKIYNLTKRLPGARQFLKWIGPVLLAVARKPGLVTDRPFNSSMLQS